MGKRKNAAVADAEERVDVHVWNHEGDVIETKWSATWDEVDELREKYRDEPGVDVVVSER